MRGLVEMGKRRAKLWCLPQSDVYANVFRVSHDADGHTWAKKSLAILRQHGLADFPDWEGNGSISGYTAYLHEVLESQFQETWAAAVKKHCLPVPYDKLVHRFPCSLRSCLFTTLPWSVLLMQRSFVRLRCGLVSLGHRRGRHTGARVQACIGCGNDSGQLWAHVFGECLCWESLRTDAVASLGLTSGTRSWDIMYGILSCSSDSCAYVSCVSLVAKVVADADKFWKDQGS